MDLVVTACWWGERDSSIIFWKVNTKVLTGQTVKRNRWRDHRCHYGQVSWYTCRDEEWVTGRCSMICASSWLQRWNDGTSNNLLECTTPQTLCRGWDLFIHVSLAKSSFYSTHLQVRFTVVSENRSTAISMWLKSNTHIQPTPLLCPRFQVLFTVDVQNCISMVVIWAFIEIHNAQGYSHVNYLNCCFASIAILTWPFGILIHIRIPMWSQLWVNW